MYIKLTLQKYGAPVTQGCKTRLDLCSARQTCCSPGEVGQEWTPVSAT